MSNFEYVNPNPEKKNVGDCTVRAISLATVGPMLVTMMAWNRVVTPVGVIAGTKGKRT